MSINWKKYPKKKVLNTNDSIIVSRPDGSVVNFDSPISVNSNGKATFSGDVDVTGNLDVDGTINIDAADIDGNLQLDGTLTVGVDDTGYDVKFFGATSGKYMKWNQSDDKLKISDGAEIGFGDADDLKIYHDGSNSYIKQQNARTGNLYIDQDTNDADIVFRNDDGSGGRTEYLTIDGGATRTVFSKETLHNDNIEAKFGGGIDLRIFSDGTDGSIKATNGDLYIVNTANDKDIIFQSDDGSGGVTTYIQLDGSDLSTKILTQKLIISNLPTSDPGVSGQVWNNNGVLNISAGG